MEISQNKNLACRIFKEQLDLVLQLPENERAEVLYKAILSAFNQIEFQNENQIENQNENAYVSVSVSVLGKTVFNLLKKNIACKEFSNNYGGRRINAGRPKKSDPINNQSGQTWSNLINSGQNQIENQNENKKSFTPPSLEEVIEYAKQMNSVPGMGGFRCTPNQVKTFYSHYESQNWIAGNTIPIRNWQHKLKEWCIKDNTKTPRLEQSIQAE